MQNLQELAASIRQTGEVDLDASSLGDEIADFLLPLFPCNGKFRLTKCTLGETSARSLNILGVSQTLKCVEAASIDLRIFDSVATESKGRKCLLLVKAPDKSVDSYVESYLESVDGYIDELSTLEGTFSCVFSSVDYSDFDSCDITYPNEWTKDYPSEQVRRGVNFFAAGVCLDDNFAGCLPTTLGSNVFDSSSYGVICDTDAGLLGNDAKRDRYLRLRKVGSVGPMNIGPVNTTLKQVELWIPLTLDMENGLELQLAGDLSIGQSKFEVSAAFDLRYETVTARISNLPTLSDILGLIGGPTDSQSGDGSGLGQLRDLFKSLLNITLSEAWIMFRWPGDGAGSAAGDADDERILGMGFSLTTAQPIQLFGKDFQITPKLEMQINYPFSETMRTLEGTVSGQCELGEVALKGELTIPDWSFRAQLDSTLGALAKPLGLSTIRLPGSAKVDFTVSGDVPAKFYSASLVVTEANASWGGTGDATGWNLSSVAIEVDYDGSNGDSEFSYWLDAALEIQPNSGHSYKFDVDGGYDGGWFLSGSTESEIDLSQLINDLLKGLSLPQDMPNDLTLTNVALSANFTSGDFSLSGQTAKPWQILGGASLDIEHFDFEKSSEGISARILVSLTIVDVVIRLSAEKAASEDGGWEFKGSTGQAIKIGDLIKHFDANAKPPPVLDGFTIENLGVSFNTATKDFSFTCEGKLTVEGTEVDIVVKITITHEGTPPKPKAEFEGTITVGDLDFTGDISTDQDAKRFLLTYTPKPPKTSEEINITELVRKVYRPVDDAMPELTIGVEDALFVYEKDEKADKSSFLIGADFDISAKIDTSDLGVIGSLLGGQEIGLDDLRVLVASADFSTDQATALNKLLPEGIKALPVPDSEGKGESDKEGTTESKAPIAISKGFNFSGNLKLGSLTPPPLMLPVAGSHEETGAGGDEAHNADGDQGKSETSKETSAESSTAKWIDIKKSLGPLYFGRVGFQYREQKIGLLLDAAVDLAGLRVGLMGFQVGFPLSPPFYPSFDLDGLELAYATGPVQITGSFLRFRQEGKPDQYDGMALIKAANFMIAGLGSYTTVAGAPSMFIYAVLHAELGGPPFFRVQGLAAGFGYNRRLTLPPIEEVHKFPFVRAALDENFITKDMSVGHVLGTLRDYVSPSLGDYWLAAGIRFSSFEMLQSFALLSVSFGHEVEIGLLGLSKMSLPRGTPPGTELAYAELALRVVVKPEEGTVAVEGRLTDASYILSKDCRLTGGFAFFLWSTGEHAGDFVVTLGGYHPKFVRPAHYPIVPRLGIHWQVSKELLVTAEMYFALTPSCLMAGGKLSAVYESDCIKAWFVAYADFLLKWQPLYYTADMGVFIAVTANLELVSIHVELNVGVHLWGPPFAGQIDVDLDVISFTVRFGEAKTLPPPLKASEFKEKFLPSTPSDVLVTQINSGLIRQETGGNTNEPLRVVNAHALALSVQSLIPVTEFSDLAKKACEIKPADQLGVRPMGITKLVSGLSVSINDVAADKKNLRVSSIENGVPEALWSKAIKEGEVMLPAPEAKTITPTVGIRLSFDPIHPQGALPAMDIEKFAYETFNKPIPWDSALESSAPLSGNQTKKIDEVMSKETVEKRNPILEVLARQRSDLKDVKVDLNELVKHRESYFQADPIVCALGSISESI